MNHLLKPNFEMLDVLSSKYWEAIEFACIAHKNQKYGIFPYIYHLKAVEHILGEFGFSTENHLFSLEDLYRDKNGPELHEIEQWETEYQINHMLSCAAWLHDTVEDCEISISQIQELFGEHIASLVQAVTNEQGANRREKLIKTAEKIRGNLYPTILKLADRIANVKNCLTYNRNLLQMYQKEHDLFREKIYHSFNNNAVERMWQVLGNMIEKEEY